MAKFDVQKYWWIVVIAIAAVGIAAKLIIDQWLPEYQAIGDVLAIGLIGAAFCWVYWINPERLWWAIIPGLGLFTLLAAGVPDYFLGQEARNDWVNVFVIGLGALLIGVVLKRMDAKRVLIIVAMFSFFVGILMSPFTPVLKGVLIAVDMLATGYFLWRHRQTPLKSS